MEYLNIAETVAVPLGVATMFIIELAKLAGKPNSGYVRIAVMAVALLLSVLATYGAEWYETAQTFIFSLGTAVAAYEMVFKPIAKK